MKRYNQDFADMELADDGEWIRYEDHVEAMKRIAGAAPSASAQQAEPVAWMRVNSIGGSTGVTDVDFYRDRWLTEGSTVVPLYAALSFIGASPAKENSNG